MLQIQWKMRAPKCCKWQGKWTEQEIQKEPDGTNKPPKQFWTQIRIAKLCSVLELKPFFGTLRVLVVDTWRASWSLSDAKAFANATGSLAGTTTIVEVAVKAVAARVPVFHALDWCYGCQCCVALEKNLTMPRPNLGDKELSCCLPRKAGRHVSLRDLDILGVNW